jgi:quercetin dioxygenase-like cupin family protein
MSDQQSPAQLQSTFVVVHPDLHADAVPVTDSIWSDLDEHYDKFKGRLLVAAFSFKEDWPTWEMHPHGDEVVTLVSGSADLRLMAPGGERSVRLQSPGDFVIVPRGTWHTARIATATTMLFVTPGEGTENRAQPGSDDGPSRD